MDYNPEIRTTGATTCGIGWIKRNCIANADIIALVSDNASTMPFGQDIELPAIGMSFNNSDIHYVLGNMNYNGDFDFVVVGVAVEDFLVIASKLQFLIKNLLHNRYNTDNSPVIIDGINYGTVTECQFLDDVYYSRRNKEENVEQYCGALFRLTIQGPGA